MNLEYISLFSSVGWVGLFLSGIFGIVTLIWLIKGKPLKLWFVLLGVSFILVVVGFGYLQLKIFEIYNLE